MSGHGDAKPGARGFLGYFVGHRTAANLLLLLMVLGGAYAGTKIRAQFFPDVVIDTISVSIAWPGVGPKEMDEAVATRLEPKLRAVEGVKKTTATAKQGSAAVTLEFQPGWDMTAAHNDVTSALGELRDLPAEAEKPVVRRTRWRDRVTDVVISGDVGVELLDRYAEELKDRLFRIGVTSTSIQGISDPVIRVDVRPEALKRHGLTLLEIATAIEAESGTKPIGEIEGGGARIRAPARDMTPEALGGIAVRSLPDGTKIMLRDVARIADEGLDREVAIYHDGKPAVILQVQRDAAGDAIKIQDQVEKTVAELQPTLAAGVDMFLAHARAQAISDRLDLLIRNGLGGLVIVVTLLFLFLSSRTAFWVAAGIPVAMAATVALMYVFGFTFNMISLFALIICLGIVVDDAIVVGEHADHLARKGLSPAEAATQAARRMAAPVFAASATTVIAFCVLGLIGGRFGALISDIPFTVAVVLIASIVESFLILPAHLRHALSAKRSSSWINLPSRIVNRGFERFRDHAFRPFLRTVVRLRYPVVATAILLLSLSVSAFFDKTVRWKFFSSPERSVVRANLAMLPNATRADTKAMVDELDRAMKVVDARYAEKYGQSPLKVALARVGGMTGRRGLAGADTKNPDLLAGYEIELIDPDKRPYSSFEFIRDWRAEINKNPLLETLALRGERSGPGGDAIDIRLAGADEATLKEAAETIKAALAHYPAASGIEDDLAYDKPELLVTVTPKGEAMGFTTASVAQALRQRLEGIDAVKLARGTRELIVKVQLPESEVGPQYLHKASVPLAGGGFTALTEIAEIREVQGFSSIRRENGDRTLSVKGDLSDDAEASAEVMTALKERILPDIGARYGISWSLGGLAEQESDFLSEAVIGLMLALAGIYLTLAWVFGSWSRPMIVMLVIPLGLIGAIWGHWLHGLPLSMFSVVGLLGMAGIVINDSIVLVTTIDERARRTDMLTSIVDGSTDRLRAVMLTTFTTVGGLTPLLFEPSRQALFLKPTVITLAYGLGFAMFLVLLVTPATLAIQHDVALRLKSMRRLARLSLGSRVRAG